MRFHVVSLPHTNTTQAFSACAFTEKVRKFCIMMKMMHHEVFLYAGETNEAPCDEHVMCVTEIERMGVLKGAHYTAASFDYSLPHWRRFNQRAAEAIKARAQPGDFVCIIGGLANKQLADALPGMMIVEFGIGYGGTFAPYRIWESYAWMHLCYGAAQAEHNPNAVDGIWMDAVIPGYFETENFTFSETKDDYFLYVGRLTDRKGYRLASQVAEKAKVRLILAGTGDEPPAGTYGEFIGHVGPAQRNALMSRARALFVPTLYIEPFGNVAVEAQACGTPVICTDWGAMTETVLHGTTGFRCRTYEQFRDAMSAVRDLDPFAIKMHAVSNYSLPVVALKYDTHFKSLAKLTTPEGWYAEAA